MWLCRSISPGNSSPPVSTSVALSNPAGGADARGATPFITPLTSMYRAPSSITVPLSNVTRCPRTTSGSGSSGAAGGALGGSQDGRSRESNSGPDPPPQMLFDLRQSGLGLVARLDRGAAAERERLVAVGVVDL